jgi:hypothetical protein
MEGLRRLHRPHIHTTLYPFIQTRSVTQEGSLVNNQQMSLSPPLLLLGLGGRRAKPRSPQPSHTGGSRRVTALPGRGICC